MRLYLIRHAQSTNNALKDIKLRVKDAALTALGHQQAHALAHYLASAEEKQIFIREDEQTEMLPPEGFRIDELYCSPMHRALLTTQPVAAALEMQPQVWVDIHEHGGIFLEESEGYFVGYGGRSRREILAEFPDYLLPPEITEDGWWKASREEQLPFEERVYRVAARLNERQHEDVHVAMISHGDFLDKLIKALLGQPLAAKTSYFMHFNTGITCLDFRNGRGINVIYQNKLEHLAADLVS